jgi:C4-dicarboxylate transporter DctQ subunit
MAMRVLDRLEETLISALMAAAVIIIFVAVTHRFAVGAAADLVGLARGQDDAALLETARSLFRAVNAIKLTWAQEACIYLFVWMAKFGAAYGVRLGIHVGVDVVVERLPPGPRHLMTIVAMSGGILFTAIVAWIGADFVWHVRVNGQTTPDLEIPSWIVYLAVPLGSALMCFRFIQALYLYLRTGFVAHHEHGAVEGIEDDAQDAADGGRA